MTSEKIDSKYYINVARKMYEQNIDLPRPKMKPKIFVTGWNEWLPIIIL
jgi:hypothetical protein